jgi:hypothetical protein
MTLDDERSAERRWIVLAEDGRFVTLGRASDPTEQEILDSEAALLRQGLPGGWLAVMQGNPHVGAEPRLMEVRCLGEPKIPFDKAARACVAAIMRRRAEVQG